MSGPWRPKVFEGQSLAKQIEDMNKEKAAASAETRYQPIAPYGRLPSNINNTPERRRIGRACDECRRKKIKCYTTEGSASCKNCISYEKGCAYTARAKKRGPPRGYINILETRLKRIEGLIDVMSSDSNQQNETTDSTSSTTTTGHNSSEDDDNGEEDVHISNDTQQQDTRLSTAKYIMHRYKETHLSQEGRFVSGSSVAYIFSRKIKQIYKNEFEGLGIDLQHNENDDYFHIKRKSSLSDRRTAQIDQLVELGVINSASAIGTIDDWIWKVAGIDKSLSDRLLKVYFAYIHPLLPVINKITFLEEYRGIRPCFPAGPLLNAVYGASIRYIENCRKFGDVDRLDNGKPWNFPENLSDMLFQNLIIFVKGKYSPCLSTIQAIVIAHNHSANVESWTSGWLLNCIAVRMSQDIGLHRSSEGWSMSQQDKETRRMVWWSVYLLDRWFSSGTGRPLTAFDEDCDELYPSESVSIDEIMDTMTEDDQHLPRFPSLDERVAAKAPDKCIPMNQPFLHLLKLSEILGKILQGLYTPKAKKHSAEHGSDAIVAYLDDALSNWRASLPPLLEISSAGKRSLLSEDHTPLLSMSGLICLSYCTLLILLHRPFIEKEEVNSEKTDSQDNPSKSKLSSQSALTICTSAAIRIIEVSESMHYRDFLMVSWGFALYPVFTAALIHIHNSSNSDSIISDVAKSNLVRALAVVDKLCLLSPMAASMSNILKKVIAVSSIFVDDPDFVSVVNIRKESMEEGQNSREEAQSSSVDSGKVNSTNNSTDILKSISQSRKRARATPKGWTPTKDIDILRSHWFPKDVHINKKQAHQSTSTVTNADDGSWISQLYTPTQSSFSAKVDLQNCKNAANHNMRPSSEIPEAIHYTTQQQYQKQHDHNNNNVDAYSIRQFGFNVMNNPHYLSQNNIHRPDPNHFSQSLQQQYSFNSASNAPATSHNDQNINPNYPQENIVNPLSASQHHNSNAAAFLSSPAALFDFSEFSSPFIFGTSNPSSNTVSSGLANPNRENYNNTLSNAEGGNNDPSALFRHRPDNPFWGMPSSMEIDDWHAYLLPHQKQHQ